MSNVSGRLSTCNKCGSVTSGIGGNCEICQGQRTTRNFVGLTEERRRLVRKRPPLEPRGPDGHKQWPIQNVYHDHEEYSWTTSSGGFSRMIVQYSGAKNATGWNDADFGSKGTLPAGQLACFVVAAVIFCVTATTFFTRNNIQ